MTRSFIALVAAWCGGIGLWLVVSPGGFYATIPGVSDTGAFNIHFFRDVGLAFVASALALGVGAVLRDWRVALAGAGFPLLHGGLHLAEAVDHGPHGGAGELVATVLPGLIALTAALCLRIKTPEGRS
ncbi:hypothetical protein [uncultured Roseovarius sp.]|uniref:hypothetical protein n=1 Tax=uncultured Roseovarius sp. TaxID=293344 RepID=UPI000C8D027D|nr:hypothetical protein [Roseovarius sp.]